MAIEAGYMVPHPPIAVAEIGRGDEKEIRGTTDAFLKVAEDIAKRKPDTIILTSPHTMIYRDYFHISPEKQARGDFRRFGAGNVSFEKEYDEDLVAALCVEAKTADFPAGTEGNRMPELDHGTMVPLYFIDQRYTDYRLVRIGLSGLSLKEHWEFGKMIATAVQKIGRKCVFVASGDLSHCQKKDGPYGYRPEGPLYDEKIMEVMGKADFPALLDFDEQLLEASMECGHRSFTIMGGAFSGREVQAEKLYHEATFGVGYGVCMYA